MDNDGSRGYPQLKALPRPLRSPAVSKGRCALPALVLVTSLGFALPGAHAQGNIKKPTATPIELIKVKKDFKVELLYSVPPKTQGSWVALCHDPKGRLITSDQYGKLYRITPPKLGGSADDTRVEALPVELGE